MVAFLLWASTEFQLAEPRGLPVSTHVRTHAQEGREPRGPPEGTGKPGYRRGRSARWHIVLAQKPVGALPFLLSYPMWSSAPMVFFFKLCQDAGNIRLTV